MSMHQSTLHCNIIINHSAISSMFKDRTTTQNREPRSPLMKIPSDFHEKSFRIQHDDCKFLSRLLSKETSKSNPSFRVYYGDVPSGVPFVWETCPGTPKHPSSYTSDIRPLTPPPAFCTNKIANSSKKHSRSKLILHTLLRRVNPNKSHLDASSHPSSPSSLSSISWSSSLRSSFSDPMGKRRKRFSSWGSYLEEGVAVDETVCSASATMCSHSRNAGKNHGQRFQGGWPVYIVKKAFLSIVGRGSA